MTEFERHPSTFFNDLPAAALRLQEYDSSYTGAWFDRLSARTDPDRLTAEDFVAVSTLGVNIPANKAIWMLGDGATAITELLVEIPRDIPIWDARAHLGPDSAAWRLWDLLKASDSSWPAPGRGLGPTKLSKLLAAKRPSLVPIWDSRIHWGLWGDQRVDNYWEDLQTLHRSDEGSELREAAAAAHRAAAVGPEMISPLRIIDIVVWRWAEGCFQGRSAAEDD